MKYYFDGLSFFKNFRSIVKNNTIKQINIACSHIDLYGAKLLKKTLNEHQLDRSNIHIYCSFDVDHDEPIKTLTLLNTIATVYILDLKYLHSKVFEIQTTKYSVIYNGSCNLTRASLTENIEFMTRHTATEQELQPFWALIRPNSFHFENDFLAHYETFPIRADKKWHADLEAFKNYLTTITDSNEETYFFTDEDYAIFGPSFQTLNDTKTKLARKKTQEKFYELNEALLTFVNRHDLHPHYDAAHLTSSIMPSFYNNGHVHTIRIRYGKTKAEIKPAGSSKIESERSRSESFGKHACLEFGIDQDEFYIGMFHSPANDGIDQSFVADNWTTVKEKMIEAYKQFVGYGFYWVFWSNREGREIASYEIDGGNANLFIEFYQRYYLEEVVSYCRCYFQPEHEDIASFKAIVSTVQTHFTALLPLYNAMTYRIPKHERDNLK